MHAIIKIYFEICEKRVNINDYIVKEMTKYKKVIKCSNMIKIVFIVLLRHEIKLKCWKTQKFIKLWVVIFGRGIIFFYKEIFKNRKLNLKI